MKQCRQSCVKASVKRNPHQEQELAELKEGVVQFSSYIVGGTKAFFQNALLPNPTIYLLSI